MFGCAGLSQVLVRAARPLFGRRTGELQRRLLQGRPQGEFHPHSEKGQQNEISLSWKPLYKHGGLKISNYLSTTELSGHGNFAYFPIKLKVLTIY
jgi:hypothetical protein